jgi:phytoene dehydrogenase-like protein
MAFMFMERNGGRSTIDYPMGGSAAIVAALVRGIERHGGRILLSAHVDQILVEGGKAAGVALRSRGGKKREVIKARRAVVSNASVWDTAELLAGKGTLDKEFLSASSLNDSNSKGAVGVLSASVSGFARAAAATPRTGSFMHLHLGVDAEGLPEDLDCHHLVVNQWQDLEAPQNVCIASIPTVFDKSLAPPGKAVVHA